MFFFSWEFFPHVTGNFDLWSWHLKTTYKESGGTTVTNIYVKDHFVRKLSSWQTDTQLPTKRSTWSTKKSVICSLVKIVVQFVRPMSHLQFYRAILLRNFIARQSCRVYCNFEHRTLQLFRINKNWSISVHSILATILVYLENELCDY